MIISLLLFTIAFAGLYGNDAASSGFDQRYRPQYHFSPKQNWTNDPNGLVFFEGEYHLFFQYNPFGDEWGHMSWGHAVSRDLLHWQELPVALPEQNGIMIFTGSTVIDQHNSSGLCTGGNPCLVAVYTGHTPPNGRRHTLQTQNLAYSNDRGRTWTKYAANPVLNLGLADFRDPKVFWSDESGRWVMLVSLPDDHEVLIYGSRDLRHWERLSEFGPAGATGGQWECPELFKLSVDGDSTKTRWVLKVGLNPGGLQGGSGEQYFVGRFNGTRFVNDNPASITLWTDYGKDCYCALTFNGLPPDRAPVMMGWMNNWQYAVAVPTSPWRGQMTIPRKLGLRTTGNGIRLVQQPVEALQEVREPKLHITGERPEVVNRSLSSTHLDLGETFELQSTIALGATHEVGWRILAADGSSTIVGYDRRAQELFVDRTHSGVVGFSKDFPARTAAPLSLADQPLWLDVLIDRCSIEVFADKGRIAITDLVFPVPDSHGIQMYASGGQAGDVSVALSHIRSTHSQQTLGGGSF